MAALLKLELDVEAELVRGDLGEFTVWVGRRRVSRKLLGIFPRDAGVVRAVRRVLHAGT